MQDSLCGSMGVGIAGAPRSPNSSCSTEFMNMPASPIHQSSSISDLAGSAEERADFHTDIANYSSSSSKGDDNMVAAHGSPENPNYISSWISDMLDELSEPTLDDSPMLFSPPHDFTSHMSSTPSYSSFSENLADTRQELSGSPLLPSTSPHSVTEDGVESPHASRFNTHEHFSSQLTLAQLDAEYRRQAIQYHHLHHHHQHHHQQQQLLQQKQQPQQQQQHQQQLYDHHLQKQKAKYHFSQSISNQAKTHMQASSNGAGFPYSGQPFNSLHKAVSEPQLSKLDPARRPALSLPPTQSSFNSSPQSKLFQRSSTVMNPSDGSRFFRRNAILACSRSNSPNSYPDSPPSLPNSLPSMGYLSNRMSHPARSNPMQPLHHQQSGQASSHRNSSLPPSPFSASGNASLRESMAPLQQSSSLPMVHFTELQQQDRGLRLVHLLLACAEAVAKENYFGAKEILHHLKQVVSVNGDSMQRVAAYFTDALQARLAGTGIRSYVALRSVDPATADEVLAAYQILYQACPYVKFAHFTSNQAIFEAFEGENRVHVVDLDIIQGYQWPAFIQALAARPGGAPRLRITGVGMPFESVQETGKRLSELAESLRVPFEFHPVGERLENLKCHMLQRRIGEALAINSVNRLHRLLSEPVSPLFGVLHMIREQAPKIFTLMEQEASHNGPFFLGRFLEALHYYSAIFDSLDATLPQTRPERLKVEQLFSNEITNIVACEGGERVERHEKLEKWRKVMEGLGFENVPLSANAVNQSKLLLGLYPCDGYTLVEDRGGLLLGWQERPIVAASTWRC